MNYTAEPDILELMNIYTFQPETNSIVTSVPFSRFPVFRRPGDPANSGKATQGHSNLAVLCRCDTTPEKFAMGVG